VNALIATVIVIGSRPRVDEAASALDELRDRGGVRRVLISEGAETRAQADEQDTTIRVDGLSPQYVDNAVAWLRLSSLPAVVWWRTMLHSCGPSGPGWLTESVGIFAMPMSRVRQPAASRWSARRS